jgi:hypothetical protein
MPAFTGPTAAKIAPPNRGAPGWRRHQKRSAQQPTARADVALVFDYQSEWVTQIQPQGRGFSAFRAAFEWYETLRGFGLDVDLVGPDADLSGYRLIALALRADHFRARLATQLRNNAGLIVAGPRAGSKTADFQIPPLLPPGDLADLFGVKVERVESLRPGLKEHTDHGAVERWLEHGTGPARAVVKTPAGAACITPMAARTTSPAGRTPRCASMCSARCLSGCRAEGAGAAGWFAAAAAGCISVCLQLRAGGAQACPTIFRVRTNSISRSGGAHLPAAGVAAWRV